MKMDWRNRTLAWLWIVCLAAAPAHADETPEKAEAPQAVERPPSVYAFKEAPAKALAVLSRLRSDALGVKIAAAEEELFRDAQDGKLDEHTFAEAVLLASGVLDDDQRKAYLTKLDKLEAQARAELAKVRTPLEKGQRLLEWLHAGPMAGGYESRQTDVSVILDTGKFNCVSSAALYNVLGRRLGLDLRAIEVPDHAFAILYDGSRKADVETTTQAGFNPSRDPAAKEEIERTTGFHYIPDLHPEKRREVGEAGLAAIIYYNHGVVLAEEKRYHEALLANFRALSLDAEFSSAVKNVLSSLANWSVELADRKDFSKALDVLSAGLELAPEDGALLNNRTAIWEQWARATFKADDADQALAILDRAAADAPDEAEHFGEMKTWLFIEPGEKLADEGDWQGALAAAEPGLMKLTGTAHEEMLEWRNGIYLRWSKAALDQAQFEQAADVLERGRKVAPDDERLENNLQYVAQEWLSHAYEGDDSSAGRQTLEQVLGRLRGLPELDDVARAQVQRFIVRLCEGGKFDDALTALDEHRELLASFSKAEEVNELYVGVYSRWSQRLFDDRRWSAALDVYAAAIERLPEEQSLQDNLAYTVQEWARAAHEAQTEDEEQGEKDALSALTTSLDRFGKMEAVREVALNHARRVVSGLCDKENYAQALEAAQRHGDLLRRIEQEGEVQAMSEGVYDKWARPLMDDKKWAEAIAVYQGGLKQFPDSKHLANNLKYCRQESKRKP